MNIDQIKQWLSTPEMQEKLRYGGYGALGGAALGGVNHLMTNEDEEGSGGRLMKNLALGGAMGGVAGLGAHSAKDLMKPVKEKSELEKFLDDRPAPYGSIPTNIAGQAAQGARNPFVMGGAGAAASLYKDHKYIDGKDSKLNKAVDLITGKDSKINAQWGGTHLGTDHADARSTISRAFGSGGVTPQVLDSLRNTVGNSNMSVDHQNDLHAALGDKANKYVSSLGGKADQVMGGTQNVAKGLWNQFTKLTDRSAVGLDQWARNRATAGGSAARMQPAISTVAEQFMRPGVHNPASTSAGLNTGLKPAGWGRLNELLGLQGPGASPNYASNAVMPGNAIRIPGLKWLNTPTVAQSMGPAGVPVAGNAGRMAGNAGKWGVASALVGKYGIDPLMNAGGDKWLQSDAYKKHMQQAYDMAQQATKQQTQQVR